jgi:hypothetical protein
MHMLQWTKCIIWLLATIKETRGLNNLELKLLINLHSQALNLARI